MERVSMNDGLDGRETVAFGLAAGEVAVFVLALLTGYAALRSGLPTALAWCLAVLLVAGGAILAWGRLAGRPLLEWALLLARFTIRTRHARLARLRQRWRQVRLAPRGAERGAVDVRLALRSHSPRSGGGPADAAASPPRLSVVGGRPPRTEAPAVTPATPVVAIGSRVVTFFSLCGGAGRTTLAVEVAALLAVRGRAAAAAGGRGTRVALVDVTERSPLAALRLGIPLPVAAAKDAVALLHETGLLVYAGLPAEPEREAASAAWVGTVLGAAESAGADVIVVDIDCDLGGSCREVLRRCNEVMVTVTPTAGGVLDAYRSTAVLRRLGLRDRVGYVANRWHDGVDLGEAMADLGGSILAEVPEDHCFVAAENRHRLVGVGGGGPASAALGRLADAVEMGARDDGAASGRRARGHAG